MKSVKEKLSAWNDEKQFAIGRRDNAAENEYAALIRRWKLELEGVRKTRDDVKAREEAVMEQMRNE